MRPGDLADITYIGYANRDAVIDTGVELITDIHNEVNETLDGNGIYFFSGGRSGQSSEPLFQVIAYIGGCDAYAYYYNNSTEPQIDVNTCCAGGQHCPSSDCDSDYPAEGCTDISWTPANQSGTKFKNSNGTHIQIDIMWCCGNDTHINTAADWNAVLDNRDSSKKGIQLVSPIGFKIEIPISEESSERWKLKQLNNHKVRHIVVRYQCDEGDCSDDPVDSAAILFNDFMRTHANESGEWKMQLGTNMFVIE